MKIKLKITDSYIKIYIDDILHLQIPYFKYLVFQSWKQGKSWYIISIYDKKGKLLSENWYKDKEMWMEIIKVWDENIN